MMFWTGYRLGHPRFSNIDFVSDALEGSMYSQTTSSLDNSKRDVLAIELRTEKVQETKMQDF